MGSFSEERNPDQKLPETETKLLEKFVINLKSETVKYEIIRMPVVLQRVEVNLLKSTHYY